MRVVALCVLGVLVGCGSELDAWCSGVADCGAQTKAECLELEEGEVANAESWGCEDAYEAYLACRNNNAVCASGVYTPDPVNACASASLGYNACLAEQAG